MSTDIDTSTTPPSTPTYAPVWKAALPAGFLTGGLLIAYSFLVYLISKDWLISQFHILINILILIGVCIYAGKMYVKQESFPFAKAYLYCLIALAIAAVMGAVYGLLLFQLDGGLAEYLVNTLEERLYEQNVAQERLDSIIERVEKGFTPMGQLRSTGFSLLFQLVLALIPALFIMRKSQTPEEAAGRA